MPTINQLVHSKRKDKVRKSKSPVLNISVNTLKRKTNNLGGIEGGMTTGEEIIIRCVMKPIPTLYKPLDTINVNTLEKYKASVERSDSCAVPACSIVCENVVAFVICKFFLEKFSGDCLEDIKNNYNSYVKRLGDRGWKK